MSLEEREALLLGDDDDEDFWEAKTASYSSKRKLARLERLEPCLADEDE